MLSFHRQGFWKVSRHLFLLTPCNPDTKTQELLWMLPGALPVSLLDAIGETLWFWKENWTWWGENSAVKSPDQVIAHSSPCTKEQSELISVKPSIQGVNNTGSLVRDAEHSASFMWSGFCYFWLEYWSNTNNSKLKLPTFLHGSGSKIWGRSV